MNTIARIAAIALSITAAGTALAESPNAAGPQVVFAQPAALKAPTAIAAGTVVTEDQLQRGETIVSTRTRADVRAETVAALANGDLPLVATDGNVYGGDAVMARARADGRLAALTR